MSPARSFPRPCPWILFFLIFSRFWPNYKTHGKTKKKFRPMFPARPLSHGSDFFFLIFSRFWPNYKKPWKNKKKQKVQTHVPSQVSPQTLPMGLNFFFCFSRGFGQSTKNHEKIKKKNRPTSLEKPKKK